MLRKMTLIGGPCAGEQVESESPSVMVPILTAHGIGWTTYTVRRVTWGKMAYYLGIHHDHVGPVSPPQIIQEYFAAKPKVFGNVKA